MLLEQMQAMKEGFLKKIEEDKKEMDKIELEYRNKLNLMRLEMENTTETRDALLRKVLMSNANE